jgi:prevent-host-death family protein
LTNPVPPLILVKMVNQEPAMTETVSLYDAKTHLSQLVDRAAEGEEIMISKNGKPLARLMPLANSGVRRLPAGALGIVRIGSDFDDTLPPAIQAGFEGRE